MAQNQSASAMRGAMHTRTIRARRTDATSTLASTTLQRDD